MPTTYTPLRYPGGKTKLYNEIKPLVSLMGEGVTYIEPFAGGAGLALKLLFWGDVQKVVLNDIDVNVYLFWKCCIEKTDEFCELIASADLSISEWEKQRNIVEDKKCSDIKRAFALFYLNRCNRSGIIKGGPIGGKDQIGKYRIDARFNKSNLIKKVKAIGQKSECISVHCMDGKDFLSDFCSALPVEDTFINIDPPYVKKGPELYKNSFTKKDHTELSIVIKDLRQKWVVTYDNDELISNLYHGYYMKEITLGYSAGNSRKCGKEYLITNIIQNRE